MPNEKRVRVTRIHANGGSSTRDLDIYDREAWKRAIRGAKETLELGGEHHMRPLYSDDVPAVSQPSPLKLRVEALEAGIAEFLEYLSQPSKRTMPGTLWPKEKRLAHMEQEAKAARAVYLEKREKLQILLKAGHGQA